MSRVVVWITQPPYHFVKVPERPWPTMSQDKWHGIRTTAGLMDKMNRLVIDGDLVMLEGIHRLLVLAPVIGRVPVFNEFLQVGKLGAVCPILVADFVRASAIRASILSAERWLIVSSPPA